MKVEQSIGKKSYWLIMVGLLLLISSFFLHNTNLNDIGMSFFQWIKKMKGAKVDLSLKRSLSTIFRLTEYISTCQKLDRSGTDSLLD